jgi:hypothetical protein
MKRVDRVHIDIMHKDAFPGSKLHGEEPYHLSIRVEYDDGNYTHIQNRGGEGFSCIDDAMDRAAVWLASTICHMHDAVISAEKGGA